MTDFRVVLSTAGSREEAKRIARELVEHRLAACVNLLPNVTSIYRWKDGVESAEEVVLLIKTTAAQVRHVSDTIKKLHTYELPESIVLAIEDGSAPYLDWVRASSR